jgi:integrase/recombinase XerD
MEPMEPLDTLEQAYLDHHRQLNHSDLTLARYQQTLFDFHRFLKATGRPEDASVLTTQTIADFGTWLKATPIRGWRGSTVRSVQGLHGRLRDMKAFTRWLTIEEYLDRAPRVVLPKLPKILFAILTEEEMDTIMHCRHLNAPGDQAVRNHAIFAVMLETGIRLAEVAGIRLEDVELNSGSILITGKGHKQRRVFFTPGVEARLRDWLEIRGTAPGSLFELSRNGIAQIFRRISQETGVPVHPHLLRHQAATYMVRAHANLHTVQRILGHASVTVTEGYLSLSDEDLRQQHAAASPYERVSATLEPPQRRKRRRLSLES